MHSLPLSNQVSELARCSEVQADPGNDRLERVVSSVVRRKVNINKLKPGHHAQSKSVRSSWWKAELDRISLCQFLGDACIMMIV